MWGVNFIINGPGGLENRADHTVLLQTVLTLMFLMHYVIFSITHAYSIVLAYNMALNSNYLDAGLLIF